MNFSPDTQYPSYRIQAFRLIPLALEILMRKRRSWKMDGRLFAQGISSIKIIGSLPLLPEYRRGWLILINHYSRPDFGIWWAVAALSAWFPHEIHWVMSAEWTYPDPIRKNIFTPLTSWFFKRISETYSFTLMPAMPPRPVDKLARSSAIRDLTRYARNASLPVVGLAPEGADHPEGYLSMPPAGSGKLIWHLTKLGLALLPVGIYEEDRNLCLQIGDVKQINLTDTKESGDFDRLVAVQTMQAIASCLPDNFPSFIHRQWREIETNINR